MIEIASWLLVYALINLFTSIGKSFCGVILNVVKDLYAYSRCFQILRDAQNDT